MKLDPKTKSLNQLRQGIFEEKSRSPEAIGIYESLTGDFVPFVNERDHLGKLITKMTEGKQSKKQSSRQVLQKKSMTYVVDSSA